jgi:hypothetical protein
MLQKQTQIFNCNRLDPDPADRYGSRSAHCVYLIYNFIMMGLDDPFN